MRHLIVGLAIGLTACATTSAGLYESPVEETFTSTKPPSTVANCAADHMRGGAEVRNDGNHYWVLRQNGYGMTVVRWDFIPDGNGGTRIERRSSIPVNTGAGDVRACL